MQTNYTTVPDNYFEELQSAICHVGMQNDATNLYFKGEILKKKTKFEDYSEWVKDVKNQKGISLLISIALDEEVRTRIEKLIN